jgi:tetrahydromethanopterin S-methyltransferase subunit G
MNKLSKYEAECKEVRTNMHDKLKVIHKRVDEILEQVKLTNGRVSALESWKDQFVGGGKVLLLISIILGIFKYLGIL